MTEPRVPQGAPWLVQVARVLLVACSLMLLFFGTTDSGWSLSGYVGWILYTLWGLLFFYVLSTMRWTVPSGTAEDTDKKKEQAGAAADLSSTDLKAMRNRVRRHKQERRGDSGVDSVG